MIGLIVGQLLVWALGAACVAALFRGIEVGRRNALVLGYGYPIGTVALTLWMRALSIAGVHWSWLSVGIPLVVAAAVLQWHIQRSGTKILALRSMSPGDVTFAGISRRVGIALWWMFVALIALHLLFAGLEIIWRPLFPWDAWTQWATKARVWYETLRMTPFADSATWFSGGAYTDAVPGYPANVPLLQVWASITLGRWDDSLMNVPSLCLAASLALAFYGQLRLADRGALLSIASAYAVLSLPLLDTHVALAGYADLPLAVYFGLSAIALWRWTVTRERAQLVVAVVLAIACPFTKYPGWAWICVLLAAVIVTLLPRRGVFVVAAAIVGGIIGFAILGQTDVAVGGYRLGKFSPVWEPLWQNYFQFANWHLLWYVLPVLIVVNRRELLKPGLVAGTAMVASGLALLFVVFSFSNASAFVEDYSTVNRATLHLAPLMMFYMTELVQQVLSRSDATGAVPEESAPARSA